MISNNLALSGRCLRCNGLFFMSSKNYVSNEKISLYTFEIDAAKNHEIL